jgi:hypothetical protein
MRASRKTETLELARTQVRWITETMLDTTNIRTTRKVIEIMSSIRVNPFRLDGTLRS